MRVRFLLPAALIVTGPHLFGDVMTASSSCTVYQGNSQTVVFTQSETGVFSPVGAFSQGSISGLDCVTPYGTVRFGLGDSPPQYTFSTDPLAPAVGLSVNAFIQNQNPQFPMSYSVDIHMSASGTFPGGPGDVGTAILQGPIGGPLGFGGVPPIDFRAFSAQIPYGSCPGCSPGEFSFSYDLAHPPSYVVSEDFAITVPPNSSDPGRFTAVYGALNAIVRSITVVPEPGTGVLTLGTVLIGAAMIVCRRFRSAVKSNKPTSAT